MKTLIRSIFLFSLLASPTIVNAQTYTEMHYVTQNGAGLNNGRSLSNAWSLSDFHNSDKWSLNKSVDGKIGPDDVVYFSGRFNDRVIINNGGSDTGPVTLDGFEAGNCSPLDEECIESANLLQGMEIGDGRTGPDFLTVQDFRMTRDNSANPGFRIYPKISGTIDEKNVDYTIVRRNYIHETNGTMFYWYGGRYNIIEGNKFVNFGQNDTDATQGVNFISVKNTLVKENEFGHSEESYPSGCTSANTIELHGCHYVIFEYNNIYGAPNGAGLVPKEGWGGNSNLIIRFNKVYDNRGMKNSTGGTGLYFRTRPDEINSNFYVYGNLIYNNSLNIYMGDVAENIYLWSNIVLAAQRIGIGAWNSNIKGLYIYNNTIAYNNTLEETDLARGGISLSAQNSEYYIKNNVLWNNYPLGKSNRKQIYSGYTINSLDHNNYFHKLGVPTIYYKGGFQEIPSLDSIYGFEKVSIDWKVIDPLFVNPTGIDGKYGSDDDDYSLSERSPIIDKGYDLLTTFNVDISNGDPWFQEQSGYDQLQFGIDDALDPDRTDWTTNPPTVIAAKQGSYGKGWELGAYVYKGSSTIDVSLSAPKNIGIGPAN